jgi:hypothetical protein
MVWLAGQQQILLLPQKMKVAKKWSKMTEKIIIV